MNLSLRRPSPARAVLLAVFLAVAVPLGLAAPASAHTHLVSVSPADGSTLTAPPTQVVLTFYDTVTSGLSVVAVKSASGALVSQGKPVSVRGVVTQALVGDLPGGTYSLAWKVVSVDGHPVTGTSRFTVTTADATPLASASAGSPSPSATPSGSTSEVAAAATSPATGSTSGGAARPSGGARGLLYVLALGALIYGALGILRARGRQRRRGTDGTA